MEEEEVDGEAAALGTSRACGGMIRGLAEDTTLRAWCCWQANAMIG